MDNQNNNIETLGDIETLDLGQMDTPATPESLTQQNSENQIEQVASTDPVSSDAAPSFVKPVPEAPKTEDLLNAVPKPDIMVSSPDANSITTDDLLEDYIGSNYDKISKRFFNIMAFIFGGLYFSYRKMVLEGILISLIVVSLLFASSMINPFISLIILIVSRLLFCIGFNKLYISSSKKKMDTIRKNNKAKSVSDLKRICPKKGGVNIIFSIVTAVLVIGLLSTVMTNFFPTYI